MGKSVGQVVGGIAGAVGGFIFGGGFAGAIKGAAYGYSLGALADPPDLPSTEGPRLDDRQFQSAEYGIGLPTVHGDYAFRGNVIYLENGEYKEIAETQEVGGKGGAPKQEHTTYRYLATFAVAFSRPVPANSNIRRVWLGSKLIYNPDSNDLGTLVQSSRNRFGGDGWVDTAADPSGINTTQGGASWVFYDGTQTAPDPRMEAVLGVGNAPSYNGTAYMMFYDLDLTDFGNTLAGAQVKAEIITTPPTSNMTKLYEKTTNTGFAIAGGTEACWYLTPQKMISFGVQPNGPTNTGRLVVSTPFDSVPSALGSNTSSAPSSILPQIRGVVDNSTLTFASFENPLGTPITPSKFELKNGNVVYCHIGTREIGASENTFSNQRSYSVSNMNNFSPVYDPLAVTLDETNCYVIARNASFEILVYVFDFQMNLQKIWNTGDVDTESGVTESHAYYNSGAIYFASNVTTQPYTVTQYFPDSETVGNSVTVTHTVPFTTGSSNRAVNFTVFGNLLCAAEYNATALTEFRHQIWKMFDFARNGVSLDGVVESICNRAGIPDSALNLTALSSDTLRGYLEAAPASPRGNLHPLMTAFLFDLIEDGYTLRAVKRGGSPVKTVSLDELDARPTGSIPGVMVARDREMIHRLPSSYTINYIDFNREYENSSQTATMSTNAFNERIEPLPVVLNSDEAAQLADVLGKVNWIERDRVNFTLSLDHFDLKASDVISLETSEGVFEQVRIEQKTELHDQRVSITGKITDSVIYSSTLSGSDGLEPDENIGFIGESDFIPVDGPMLLDTMDNHGVVSGMSGQGKYPGGVLMRSLDGGQTYTRLQAYTASVINGRATDTMGAADPYVRYEGETLNVRMFSGAFSSVTFDQMMRGVNYVAYGIDGRWEIMQFQNAILESDGTYTLDTFIRGQKGTEANTSNHEVDDRVVFLNDANMNFLRFDSADVGVARTYKPVTVGQTTEYSDSEEFTYNAINLKPLSGVNAYAEQSGSDLVINWTGRTRYNSSYWVTGSQPDNESTLSYEVDILDIRANSVLRTISSSTTSATYLSADQVTDFGSNVTRAIVNIYQLSSSGQRGFALSAFVYSNGYATTFNEFDLGAIDEFDNGWRFRFDASTSVPFNINSESTAITGKVLEIAPSSTNTYMYTRPKIENFADGEALYKTRLNVNFGGAFGMCYLRASGGPSTRTGYVCYLNNGPDTITILRLIDGAFTIIGNISKSVTSGVWYWVRFRVQGTSIQARMWADGAAEPGSWDINGTNSEITGEGWGAIGTSVNASMNYDLASIEVL